MGWDLPAPANQTQALASGGTVNFNGAYTVVVAENVSTPDAPGGPISGVENQDLTYDASGSVGNHGDDLEYRFDWGDGNFSAWGTIPVQNSWAAEGIYEVKAQARCIAHPAIVSDWSVATTVTISVFVAETVSVPDAPTGSASNQVGQSTSYTVTGWLNTVTTSSHAWTAAGTYHVFYRARCAEHTKAVSDWSSQDHTIEVTADPEAVSTPDMPRRNPGFDPLVNLAQLISVTGSYSNHGHPIEYQFDFGDGMISDWTLGDPYSTYYQLGVYHTYTSPGIYEVICKARCALHGTVVSADSPALSFEIFESIGSPAPVTGPATGATGANLTISTTGTTSSEGHALEYSFEYKRGSYTIIHEPDWSASLSDDYVFTEAGTYGVRVRARCATHTDAVSYHSNPALSVTISD